jgi:CPA2 family monovalent cation:H+ antiporter-2
MSELGELTGITILMLGALGAGLVFVRLRQPPLVGYIVAGVVLGPSMLGLVHNREGVHLLAEMGVLMLLFLMGGELSIEAFRRVWWRATAFVLLHLLGTSLVVAGLGWFLGWSSPTVLLVSAAISMSSTAVAMKMLDSIHELRTDVGRLTVAILIAQDLAVIPVLLWIRSAASGVAGSVVAVKMACAVGVLAALMVFLGRAGGVRLPLKAWIQDHPEMAVFASLGGCFGAASLSGLLGLSPAYGAFLGGLVLGNTGMRATLVKATETFQMVLMMVFFVSVGLLLDLKYVGTHLGKVLVFLVLVTVGKAGLNIALGRLLRVPAHVAFLAGLSLAQAGEFSFVLANTGRTLGLVTPEEGQLLLALTVLSLMTAPLWLTLARRIEAQLQDHGMTFAALWGVVAGSGEEGTLSWFSRAVGFGATFARRLGWRIPGKPVNDTEKTLF